MCLARIPVVTRLTILSYVSIRCLRQGSSDVASLRRLLNLSRSHVPTAQPPKGGGSAQHDRPRGERTITKQFLLIDRNRVHGQFSIHGTTGYATPRGNNQHASSMYRAILTVCDRGQEQGRQTFREHHGAGCDLSRPFSWRNLRGRLQQ